MAAKPAAGPPQVAGLPGDGEYEDIVVAVIGTDDSVACANSPDWKVIQVFAMPVQTSQGNIWMPHIAFGKPSQKLWTPH